MPFFLSLLSDEDSEAIQKAFKLADGDQDGFLSKDEFEEFYEINGQTITKEELEQAYLVVDNDPKDS